MKILSSILLLIGMLNIGISQVIFPKFDERLSSKADNEIVNVLIHIKSTENFSTANKIHGKSKKAQYVFDNLIKAKRQNQSEIINILTKENIPYKSFHIVNAVALKASINQLKSLATLPSVSLITEDSKYVMTAPVESKKESNNRATEWGLDKIKAPDVWALGHTGSGVVIGGQDTGYKWDHDALKEKYKGWDGMTADHDYNWHDAIHTSVGNPCGNDSPFPCDDHNHGTHTMGTMVGDDGLGKQIGVAPDAKWIACRNMDQGNGTLSTYLECFEWFLAPYALGDTPEDGDPELSPHVINNSWTCPDSEGCNSGNFPLMEEAIINLKNAGVVVVVSAGNDGSACSTIYSPPAIFESSFGVGATSSSDVIAGFSSRGPIIYDGSNLMKPNVSAPGVSVYSSIKNGGYASYNGTSMAGPHVAGAVALIISAKPELAGEVEIIEDLLEQTAVQLVTAQTCGGLTGTDTPNNTYGYGRIDVLAAVNQALKEFDVPIIKVDHFGYRPDAQKIAIFSNPITGYNSTDSYTPSATVSLKDANTHVTVYSSAPFIWNSGATHTLSGDQAWRFDFSSVITPGTYYVADGAVRSEDFVINENIYNELINTALKTFYYQRCGTAKSSIYVGDAYADTECHIQDLNAKFIEDPTNISLEKDMSGGWHDAGDYNKYVNFAIVPVLDLLFSYEFNPEAWTDDVDIPESSNGIPDLLDEVKYELDWLSKMQDTDGGVYSIVGVENYATASPPSADNATRFYGDKSTSATRSAACMFAFAAKQFSKINNPTAQSYVSDLTTKAENAWNWAITNPSETYYNSGIIGGGEQEEDMYTSDMRKLMAAIFLYDLTGNTTYKTYVENNYDDSHMIQWGFVYPFEHLIQLSLLYYAHLDGVDVTVADDIKSTYKTSVESSADNMPAFTNDLDPYYSYVEDANYVWGSNRVKSNSGIMYQAYKHFNINPANNTIAANYEASYLHYIHGLNPNGFTYLTNMQSLGSSKSANTIYHGWFTDGSSDWDHVLESTYGPPPGFVPGGPNPSWSLDACCPAGCGASNPDCITLTPPDGQPALKSYRDWNTSWPQNSWEITENAIGYQGSYLLLLSSKVNRTKEIIDGNSAIVITDKDLLINDNANSVILQSNSGNKYKILIDNSGNISTLSIGSADANSTKVINGSLSILEVGKGLILKSPDDSNWKIEVNKSGDLSIVSVPIVPTEIVHQDSGDILIDSFPNGLIMKDEDGICYLISVDDGGKLYCNASKCGN